MKRSRSRREATTDAIELKELLESSEQFQWPDDTAYQEETYLQPQEVEYNEEYSADYEEFYGDEYSEAHEAIDSETRFHIAMGMFDLISICVGIVVILILVGMLITLFNWLRTDIMHSALLIQSGLQ